MDSGIGIVVILNTLMANRRMAALTVRLAGDLWVLQTLQDRSGVTYERQIL